MSTDFPDRSVQCSCGQIFAQLNAYTNHQRTCKKRKKGLSSALAKAKFAWENRKRRHTADSLGEPGEHSDINAIPNPPDTGHISGHQPQENSLELSLYETNSQRVCATNQFGGLTEDNARFRLHLLIHWFQWGKQSPLMMPKQSDMM